MRRVLLSALGLVLVASASLQADEPDAEGRQLFEQRIRPLLVEHCYSCHSAEADEPRGGLRLDGREGWQHGGDSGPAIVPGKPDESLLIAAVRYDDAIQMPPSGKLPERDIAALVEWVARGAPDPRSEMAQRTEKREFDVARARQRFPFAPLSVVAPPQVEDESWCRTPIDRFILAQLEDAGIRPSPEVDRRRLIRRATFDLTGLPPTPEEIEAFVHDLSPRAYEDLLDRLLASPHYGERWGRYWLDVARFAESHGFEHDYDRPTAYHYRDFVIRALNEDLPFDTFLKWNLAGDELEPENNMALALTGFLAAGVHSTQITMNQAEKERYDELDDMLATTGSAFLGLTIGCARCHDHKYDPVPQHDYYRLLASLATTVRSEIEVPLDREQARREQEAFEAEHAPYVAALEAFEADALPERLAAWEADWPRQRDEFPWRTLELKSYTSAGGATFEVQPDGSLLATGENPEHDTYTLVAEVPPGPLAAIRLEALSHPSLAHGGPGRAKNGNFALTDLRLTMTPPGDDAAEAAIPLVEPQATFEQEGLPIAAAIDDDKKSGWAVDPEFGKDHAAVFRVAGEIDVPDGATLTFTLEFKNNKGHGLGRLRLAAADRADAATLDGAAIPAAIVGVLDATRDERTDDDAAALLAWYRTIDPEWQKLYNALETHAATAPRPETTTMLISTEGLPAVRLHSQGPDFYDEVYLLTRGDPNQKREIVTQGFLQVLMAGPDGESHWHVRPPEGWRTSYRRARLAEWLTDCEHGAGHLVARVIVNRLWQHHFGRGIVATPNDFGVQGEPPTHPELLDWLAAQLIADDWRLKPLHELIMRSAVYRQACDFDETKAAIDPANRLLWQWPLRRIDAEAIRDAMLAASGALDRTMFGPGTLDPDHHRRSIYFTIKRSELVPMMQIFDAPEALQSVALRPTTTIAPQALLLINNPQVRDWARHFARRIASSSDDPSADEWQICVTRGYQIALGREPADDELTAATAFLTAQVETYPDDDPRQRRELALADFCQVLFGLNEFVYIE